MITSAPVERLLERVARLHAERLDARRHHGRRRRDAHLAPSFVKQWMSERATRLCEMSPTIATTRPSSEPSAGAA